MKTLCPFLLARDHDEATCPRCAPEQYNHIFRTFLGLPPSKDDKPICGADLSDDWDFPGHERPACPECVEVASK